MVKTLMLWRSRRWSMSSSISPTCRWYYSFMSHQKNWTYQATFQDSSEQIWCKYSPRKCCHPWQCAGQAQPEGSNQIHPKPLPQKKNSDQCQRPVPPPGLHYIPAHESHPGSGWWSGQSPEIDEELTLSKSKINQNLEGANKIPPICSDDADRAIDIAFQSSWHLEALWKTTAHSSLIKQFIACCYKLYVWLSTTKTYSKGNIFNMWTDITFLYLAFFSL